MTNNQEFLSSLPRGYNVSEKDYADIITADLIHKGFRVEKEISTMYGKCDLMAIKYDNISAMDMYLTDFIKRSSKKELIDFFTGRPKFYKLPRNFEYSREIDLNKLDFRLIEIKVGADIRQISHGVGQLMFYSQSFPIASLWIAPLYDHFREVLRLVLDNLGINYYEESNTKLSEYVSLKESDFDQKIYQKREENKNSLESIRRIFEKADINDQIVY